jgi:hypothetical protein
MKPKSKKIVNLLYGKYILAYYKINGVSWPIQLSELVEINK